LDKGLIGEETVRNLLAWRHSGFSAHGTVRVEDRQGAARAIRRSLKLSAQEPEPLAHGPPHELELLDQIA
jgi:hypothetical protein